MRAIDLFAGAGGFTTGAVMAGIEVVLAANHWPLAVEIHGRNHPSTRHLCQDLHQVDWSLVPAHDCLLASPACQGHSRARGRERPHHDAARSTAWAVVSALEYHRPELAIVENVPEFRGWTLYPAWADAIQRLGYAMNPLVVDAADHGVPQNRKRLFILLNRGRRPIDVRLPRRAHRPVAEVIAWDAYPWTPIDRPGRSPKTLERIARGRDRFGDRFVIPYYGSGSGLTGRSIARPIGTVTTLDRWAVVDGDRMRMLQPSEYRAIMGFPADYHLPPQRRQAIHLLGNAVCPPVARDLILALTGGAPRRRRAQTRATGSAPISTSPNPEPRAA